MKISTLPEPYRSLAKLREMQKEYGGLQQRCDDLNEAFAWDLTPEDEDFWSSVSNGNHPAIPYTSLAEIEINPKVITKENCTENVNTQSDLVNNPPHYKQGSVEVFDMMVKVWGAEKVKIFCEINAFKYRMRAGYKEGANEDLKKALWYENKMKEL